MQNLKVDLSLVNGGAMEREIASGRELIYLLYGDDFGPPPVSLVFAARTDDGRRVEIRVQYDDDSPARATVG